MKKYLKNIIIIVLLLLIGVEILINSSKVMESVSFSFDIWKNNIFPSLFPFFILSYLLINYGFVELISELLKPIMIKIFKINKNAAFILVMSLVSGFPSNAKYTRELYDKNLLNDEEASKILTFTHFSNPLFILGTVSIVFLQNKSVGIFILIIHYITNIIIGLLFRNYYISDSNCDKFNFKDVMNKIEINSKNKKFGSILSNAIISSINTLLLILGTVTFFLVITTIIDSNINLNSYYQSILNGILEMTQGLKYISLLDIPLKIKATLTVMILSFGGISVHMQVISIISDTKIKYLPFLTARILHSAISGILVFILFDLFLSFS